MPTKHPPAQQTHSKRNASSRNAQVARTTTKRREPCHKRNASTCNTCRCHAPHQKRNTSARNTLRRREPFQKRNTHSAKTSSCATTIPSSRKSRLQPAIMRQAAKKHPCSLAHWTARHHTQQHFSADFRAIDFKRHRPIFAKVMGWTQGCLLTEVQLLRLWALSAALCLAVASSAC